MPFGLHPAYLIILLAIVLIIFGPGKLPELGGAVGRSLREFKKASNDMTQEVMNSTAEKDEKASNAKTTTSVLDSAKTETETKTS